MLSHTDTPEQISRNFHLIWMTERIDEMNAALASLEAKAKQAKAGIDTRADQLFRDLKERRDQFVAALKAHAESGDATLTRAKADLEAQWSGFETQVKTYFEDVGKQLEQQQAAFKNIATVQVKAWRDTAVKLREAAAKIADARRNDIEAAARRMKTDATEAEARLQKLKQAGNESWSVLSAALADSRKAFDQASQVARNAFNGVTAPTSSSKQ